MFKTASTFFAVALIATMPTLIAADSTAVSLGVSLDDGNVSAVAVAAAFGDFAVASSVANANSAGAAAGASDDAATTPSASVTYNSDAGAYETNVTFAAVGEAAPEPVLTCEDLAAALGAFEGGDNSLTTALIATFGQAEVFSAAAACGLVDDINQP